MAKIGNKKRAQLTAEIDSLYEKKRTGLLQAVISFAAMAFVIWIKLMFQMQIEWLNSTPANLGLFVLTIVAAGVCGIGTRNWNRARKRIEYLESLLSR